MLFEFGPDRRLRRHSEFARAQRSGRRITTPHFVLLVAARLSTKGEHEGSARLGVVVARKVGAAVRRNRVKRLCRECFRSWPDLVPRGVDLIVIARPGAATLKLEGVRSEWQRVERLLGKRALEALARSAGTDHPAAEGS